MQRKPSIADKTDGLLLIEFAKIVQDTVKPTSTMNAIQTWLGIVVLVLKCHKIPPDNAAITYPKMKGLSDACFVFASQTYVVSRMMQKNADPAIS